MHKNTDGHFNLIACLNFIYKLISICAQEVARNIIWKSDYMATSWNSSLTNSPTFLHVQKAPPLPCRKGGKRPQEGNLFDSVSRENASRYLLENCCAIISGSPFQELAKGQLYDHGLRPGPTQSDRSQKKERLSG